MLKVAVLAILLCSVLGFFVYRDFESFKSDLVPRCGQMEPCSNFVVDEAVERIVAESWAIEDSAEVAAGSDSFGCAYVCAATFFDEFRDIAINEQQAFAERLVAVSVLKSVEIEKYASIVNSLAGQCEQGNGVSCRLVYDAILPLSVYPDVIMENIENQAVRSVLVRISNDAFQDNVAQRLAADILKNPWRHSLIWPYISWRLNN